MRRLSKARTTILACLLALANGGCATFDRSNGPAAAENRANASEASKKFTVTNFTGTSLKGFYLSPNTSNGWEENLLGQVELNDGDTIEIQIDPNEKATAWDLRIEGVDGHYAELKEIKLAEFSELTLLLKGMPEPTLIAEAE